MGDIYLEISNRDKALNIYIQALGKYNGSSGKIKQAALQRKIERISGNDYNSASPLVPPFDARSKVYNRGSMLFPGPLPGILPARPRFSAYYAALKDTWGYV